MGYDVYITRAESWLDSKDSPISDAEWRALVAADPTLRINTRDYADRETEDGSIERQHPVEWSGSKDENCLWFQDGAIVCKNPSRQWISKMVEFAKKLGARVVGEEDEVYE